MIKREQHVPFQITVHDREEDLKKEIDGVDDNSEQKEPCFSGHHECDFTKLRSFEKVLENKESVLIVVS